MRAPDLFLYHIGHLRRAALLPGSLGSFQVKASGIESLRFAMNSFSASSIAGSR